MSTLSSQVANLSPEQLAKLAYELKATRASRAGKTQEIPRREAGDHCPLSFAQQRLWFISQLEPDDPSYNCIDALRMIGNLNVPLLEQAFKEVVRRHEALRTTFELAAGQPVQIVSPKIDISPRMIDLQALPASERERQVSKLSAAEVRRPFNLTRGPLLRVVLLRVNEHEHAIVFTMHHIISDGWSRDVLVRELIELYSAFDEGHPSTLAELPLQYADFAVWQRQRLTGAVLEEHLDYWRQQLAGAPQVLALATDHPRPTVLTRRGSYEVLKLAPELSHSLRELGRREGVTLFMTVLAAFDLLLSRYSGQTDFLIGTDIANRSHGTTEPLIGFFVNQLVLRVDLAGDPTFHELLQRVKQVTLNGYAHQEVPFEKVVETLNPERNLSHAPLFQVKLVLQNASTGTLELPEITFRDVEADSHIAKFDLTLVITEEDEGISAEMEYSTDLFESSTINRMLAQFERLLTSAVRDPELHLSQLELLGSAERHQLLVERNDTRIPYPRTRCIHELFEEQVALSPESIALTFNDHHLSYAELNARANQLAHYLRAVGVKAETPVGICLNRSLDMVVAVFAILKAGATYIPLDPQYPAERLACILDEVQPSIILTDSTLIDELPASSGQGICMDEDQQWWSALPGTNLSDTGVSSENLAHVLYTSGSTGKPKGVAVPHRGVVRLVKQETYVSYGPDEVFLQMGSLSFDASTLEIFPSLLTGGRLVLMPPGAPGIDDLAEVLTSEGVSKLWVTAGLFHPMVEHRVAALAGVKDVMAGGDVLSGEHVRRLLKAKAGYGSVINGYGPTESTVFTCCHRVSHEDEFERSVPIGKPIANTQVYVLGEKLELLADGMVGELYVGGDGLARCYYNQPELTAERFVPHPFSTEGGERLYRTGDYVRWRPDGLMEFVGRVDTQVKIRGYRIEPGEVEAVLGRHASVSDCAVVARQEDDGEKQLVAYVVTKANGESESTFELKEYLRERLPEFMIPAAIVAIESLPLTPNGKVNRRELAEREVLVGSSDRDYVAPRTPTEELLCEVWQEVLHAERVGIEDNFFDLGGDSILTIQVIVKARAVGLDLTVQQLFQHQTIHELAEQLERSDESSVAAGEAGPFSLISEEDRTALPAGVVDAYPLTALQAGMLFHSELAPGAGVYHDILSAHLRMTFDGKALRATLQQLIDRHPVLRTSFNLSDFSEPIQLVHKHVEVPLEIEDLRSLSDDEQRQLLTGWMAANKKDDFDWRNPPILRFHVHRRYDDSFQFSFTFHHAILDGWSVATLFTELFETYSAALATDEPIDKPPVGALFRDFVAAEHAILNSEDARQYWMTMLSDSTQTRLPRPAGACGRSLVRRRVIYFQPELTEGLKELASTAGVPLKSVFLAAHLRVLSLLSGRDDVLTGVVSHGRPETEDGERVLGLFLNTLPFRQKLPGGTWLQLVRQTFQAERELLPYRRYPMARVQQELGSEAPLFEVVFNFVNFHAYEEIQHVGGVEVLDYDGVADTNYTLSVDFCQERGAAGFKIELHYDTGQLSASQIEAALSYYLTALEKMVRTPNARYEQEWLLSKEEQRAILRDWNEPAPPELYRECYHKLFEAQVASTPDAVAAMLDNEQLTYEELNQRANQLAHYLRGLGVGPEVAVGTLLERSLETIVAQLAIFKAGGVYVSLDKQQPLERQQYVVADAGLALLLTHTRFKEALPSGVRAIYLDSERQTISEQSTDNVASAVNPNNLAYVIYTSGSTGRPKGVAVSHDAIVSHCFDIKEHYELQASDRVLVFSSFTFDVSLEEVLPALLTGATLILRGENVWTPKEFVRALAEQHLTVVNLPAAYWRKLTQECVAAGDFDNTYDLRLACIGNEALLPETVRLWQSSAMRSVRLIDAYGPTEAIVTATTFIVPSPLPENFVLPTIPIGHRLPTRTTYILDSHGNPTPIGVSGELHIGGPLMARGYLNRPDLTAEKFIPDPFGSQPGGRLYRTGDLARHLNDGAIEFLGRIDQQVKLRGYRIELGEIEAVLKQHESVREAVVVMHAQRLVAYVQLRVAEEVGVNDLRAFLKQRLPEYMVPSSFVEVAKFALTSGGKINRQALPAPETIVSGADYEAPSTATEELLAGLWASVLRVSQVGVKDNFIELGGHSLLAIQLISRIREVFGFDLPLSDLFEYPTVAKLAQSLEKRMRANQGLVTPPLRRVPRAGNLPLSFAQQRLWFLDQLMPESISYNMAEAIRLRGELSVAALEQSINEVRRRHEAVRTTFHEVGGNPVQVITPFRHLTLPSIDLSCLPEAEREQQVVRLASADARRPFNLEQGPLMRVTLVRLGAEDHVLLFSMHHIISDGWSTDLLAREMAAFYDAYSTGTVSPLPELAIQYGDFAVWQREWLSGDVLARQLDYWTSKLDGIPPLHTLPTDYPRPKAQLNRGAFFSRLISAELTTDLKSLAQKNGATLFMTMLAGFHALLHRYAQQATVVTGVPVANRMRAETEPLIGFFVNTLALRSDFDDDPTFLTHLNRLRKHALESYLHQDLPFEMLVDELQLTRDLSYNPLFQVMFSWEEAAWDELVLTGTEVGSVGVENRTSQFDLTLWMGEVNGQLRCSMQYNTALFTEDTIARMLAHYEELLSSAVREPQQRVSRLALLRGEERQQMLVEWNETAAPYETGVTVAELFERQAARDAAAVAVVSGDSEVTYGELNVRANRVARHLRDMGIGVESRVGLLVDRGLEMMVGLLGILKAGAAYVPLDPAYPRARLEYMLADAAVPVLLTERRQEQLATEIAASVPTLLYLDDPWSQEGSGANLAVTIDSENLAYVIYTSGSTGQPKGVMNSHRGICNRLFWGRDAYRITPEDRVLQKTPYSFDVSVWEFFWPLLNGARLVMAEPGGHQNPVYLRDIIQQEQITIVHFVPAMLQIFLQEQGVERCSSLRKVFCSGEALGFESQQQFFARFGAELHNLYGPTEAAVEVTHWTCKQNSARRIVPIGWPIANTQIHLLDQHFEPVPIGVAGELHIGGTNLARGYQGNPGLTAEKFVPNPFSDEPGARLYQTGDLARYLPDGSIEFLGRIDQQVKLRGFRIELGEIETVLKQHESVKEAIVVTQEIGAGERRLVAYVQLKEVGRVEVSELRAYLHKRLPEYMAPATFVLLAEFPLTTSGKIDRRVLPAPDGLADDDYQAPRTQTEELLANLWADVLNVPRVGVHENFFEAGGHSLLATQLMSRVREAFGIELGLREVFAWPTVAGFAARVEEALRGGLSLTAPPLAPVSRDRDLPLSHAQERMWFLDQLEPGSAAYSMPAAVRLKGRLDLEALQRTLNEVVRRHEALRTGFVAVNGQPVQLISPPSPVAMPLLDLSELPAPRREAEMLRCAQAEAAQPFDLSAGSLLRVQVLRLEEAEHVVLFTMHHIISDGWSTGVLIREVATLYEAYIEGRESPLPELEVQYADYAVWQRNWLQGEVLEHQLSYWRRHLGGELPVLELPADRPRPPLPSYRGRELTFSLSPELTDELKSLSSAEGVTLFMTLLAVFKILLWRYSGQTDVVVGTPIAGRNQLATEGLIGLFVNTLVLRTDLSANPSFRELLARVREVTLGAYAHQDLPFEKLVEELQPQRDMSRSPLFQVMFVLQNASEEKLRLPGLKSSEVLAADESAKFDLTLGLTESGGELNCSLQYSVDLFDADTVERLVQHYGLLLESVVGDPGQQLSQLPLLLEADKQKLLVEWNDTQASYDLEQCVHQLFEAQVSRAPDAVAVVYEETQLTYAELNTRANQLARYLRRLGIGLESRVGLCLERSLDLVVGMLGVLKAGAAYVPLDPQYPVERLQYMLDDSNAGLLLVHQGLSKYAGATLSLTEEWEQIGQEDRSNLTGVSPGPENVAYVIYTSGSTGRPKGVMVPHGALTNHMCWMLSTFPLTPADRVLQKTPISFDASVWEFYAPLMAGSTLVVARPEGHLSVDYLRDALLQHQVTTIQVVPTLLAALVAEDVFAGAGSLNRVFSGGEQLTRELSGQFLTQSDAELYNLYGPTECCIDATWSKAEQDGLEGSVPVGRPIANTEVYVVDSDMRLAPIGVTGELCIGGRGLARGYVDLPDVTAERFVPNPFSDEPGARLYRTGDLARHRREGEIEFLGRIDNQLKLRGYRIELGEIEAVLRHHPAVREVAVVATSDASDKRIVAYVVPSDSLAGVNDLRAYLHGKLPDYMLPANFVLLPELPLTPSGKLDRRALPVPDRLKDDDYQVPRTQTEELLLSLWCSLLGVAHAGVHDNFFESGGHSLLATQLVSRVREAFNVELGLLEVFAWPTVAGLAARVEAVLRGGLNLTAPPLVAVSCDQELPLSHAQERMWFLDQLEPGSVAYNIPGAVRLKGELDVEALQRTLNEVVRRHESLRTTFIAANGNPVQVISPPAELDIPIVDLSEQPEEQREVEAGRLAAVEARQPFELSVGPLLRVKLLRLAAEDHVVLFTTHHIINDGWSSGILVREVSALYQAYVVGDESPLKELEIQYADYAVWQRNWLQGDVLDQQLSYWRQRLVDLPVLQLPTDRPRPPVPSYRGQEFSFTLPAPLTAELKKLSVAESATLYMTLLAVFKILLWRYSGQTDVVVGTPIAGRNQLATEGLIGLFVNTLVLRTDLSANPSFRELLARVREVTLGAYAHQDLPFEKLVEELQPQRDMSRSPLFQVMFVLQNASEEKLRLPGVKSSEVLAADESAKFDLTLGLTESGGELNCSLQYSVDLFDADTVERLVQHYGLLLESVVGDPGQQLSQLPLLLEADKQKLLVEWNDTQASYDLEQCVHQLFEAQVSRTPDAVAVVAGQTRLSYAELDRRSESLARRLRREGIGPEQRVGILVRRSAEMVVAVLGVLKAGGAYVALDPDYPLERLRLMTDDAQLSLLVAEDGLGVEFTRPDLKLAPVSKATAESESEQELPPAPVTPANLAYVIYTSGSTGRPKGVAITHRSAVAFIHWARDVFPPATLAGVLASTSLSFDLSVFELFVTLSSGGKIILADNALHLPTLEAAREVTLINTVPSAMAELLRIGAVPPSVQVINLAGEALSTSLVQKIYQETDVRQVWNLYGPTEDTTYSTAALIEKYQAGPMVIGRPVTNTRVYICDEALQLVPVGVAGQLLIAGEGLARGYIGRPDLTAERFLPDPFSGEFGTRLYVTGDIARYRADGRIEFLGRADNQVKLHGFRIEPGEIETVLREHPLVRDALVIAATSDVPDDKRLVAYVLRHASACRPFQNSPVHDERQAEACRTLEPGVSDLRAYLRGRLPEYMAPSAFVLLDAFPLTPNGKINVRALPPADQSSDSELTIPRDVLELQLMQIWKEVLRLEQIGLRDNFFDLGGHSLLAVRLIDRVERLVGQKVPLSIMFQGTTIEQLAATLRSRGGKVPEQLLVSIQPQGSRPPLFLAHPVLGSVMSYVALSRWLGADQPVYGLQSRGLDPDRKPTARIEDMASEYIRELTTVQPEGPYHLGGWSMGGLIAFEMAQQLTAAGQRVATLVLIDSYIQTARSLADDETLRQYFLEEVPQFDPHLFELYKANVHASQRYAPGKLTQDVLLLQAAEASPEDAAESLKRWQQVAASVVVHQIPGNHHTLFSEPNVASLAERLEFKL